MPKYFPSYTHAVVKTIKNAADSSTMNGTIALVTLHFNDNGTIQYIGIKKMPGPVTGVTANIPMSAMIVDGKKEWYPVVTGSAADELKVLALVAFDRVKQLHGLKYNKTYKVVGTDAVETGVKNAECSAGVGEQSAS